MADGTPLATAPDRDRLVASRPIAGRPVEGRPVEGRLVDPDLFLSTGGEPQLRASRCRGCATLSFPAQQSCNNCAGTDVAEVALARRGTLWGYTVQRFVPKPPFLGAGRADSAPYAVGYVELADVTAVADAQSAILVESRIVTADFAGLRVGLPLELCLERLPAEGDVVWTFAFAPIPEEVPT